MRLLLSGVFAALAVAGFPGATPAVDGASAAAPATIAADAAASCQALAGQNLELPDAATRIDTASIRPARADLPAFCDVEATVAPEVGLEIRLPVDHWNGKYFEIGRGGYCRPISMAECDQPLRKGYACLVSDQGHHDGRPDDVWAHGSLQAKVDCGFRGNHVAALAGKAITERFFGKAPAHSYFLGCSTGGRMAMVEAERFPRDFDGIVAGAPPFAKFLNGIGLAWTALALLDQDGHPLFTPADLALLHRGALDACDAADGRKDGIVGAAASCRFDPAALRCRAGAQPGSCLSAEQVAAARRVYAGPHDSQGRRLYAGAPLPGSELGWIDAYLPSGGKPSAILSSMTAMFGVMTEPARPVGWTLSQIDWDTVSADTSLLDAYYGAANPDLRDFKAAGGKLILYHGLADPLVMPGATIDYYRALTRAMGGPAATRDFARLFLVPGLDHCINGPGAGVIDQIAALEAWVERGRAPDRLIGAHQKRPDTVGFSTPLALPLDPANVAFTRPVYPYPAETRYRGSGDPDAAASYVPVIPPAFR